ncbi:MAG TPA: glucoamylase family protein [Gemmatimonadaceae bacterium]|nr:glucoamylase family protein [Gemmatimonadaceae bacterium]
MNGRPHEWHPGVLILFILFILFILSCSSRPSSSSSSGASAAAVAAAPTGIPPGADAFLDDLQRRTFRWFWETTNPANGLTPDRHPRRDFSSVAAVGFALTAYPIGAERGWVTREQARDRVLTTLRFFWRLPQGSQPAGIGGYRGFFYHFLDMETGHRFRTVELSTIDTSLLLGGVLFCREYFDRASDAAEAEIRALADSLYFRADWAWARARPPAVSMGWHPEEGGAFIRADWVGYDEAMLLYVLALGSPTHPLELDAWQRWTSGYKWAEPYGQPHVYFGPLFGHQYSHLWVDFRGIRDEYMRGKGIDYFENSRRATLAQRAYAIENPGAWKGYGADVWGITASDGPGDTAFAVDGRRRQFFSYSARGPASMGDRDDGTLAPTAVGGSVPFAPEVTIRALMAMRERYPAIYNQYGFVDAFNPTWPAEVKPREGGVAPGVGYVDTDQLGIDQGPIIAMIENHRSELVWKMMRKSPYIRRGLERAGFTGGWLAGSSR